MKYLKPALSFQEQADLLISRGLLADRDELISYLKQVNYYRVTGYLYPFKQSDDSEEFIAGTTLEMIQERYRFDSELRLLILSAIEKIEVSILRTLLVEQLTGKYGPFLSE